LVALFGALLMAWSALLNRRMTTVPSGGRRAGAESTRTHRRLLPATATGGIIGKELRTWFRDVVRNVSLLGVVVASVFVALAPSVLGSAQIVPYGGLIAVMIAAVLATNLYGLDGGALWLTLVAPSAERPDVRGRQWAWLLIIGPPALVLTVVATALSSEVHYAFPWVLAALPALLGGGAGLVVLLSVYTAYPMPDQRAGNPLAFRSRLSGVAAVGALAGVLLLVLIVVPAGAVVLLGVLDDSTGVQWLGVPVGVATGVALFWWWGRLAHRRLQRRGPELLLLLVGRS
jgi:ABC-2 type transport system permease protein